MDSGGGSAEGYLGGRVDASAVKDRAGVRTEGGRSGCTVQGPVRSGPAGDRNVWNGNSWPHRLQVRPLSLMPPPQRVQRADQTSVAKTGADPRIISHMPIAARAGQRVGMGGMRHRLTRSHAAVTVRAMRCRLKYATSGSKCSRELCMRPA